MTALIDLQKAIIDKLKADTTLMTMVTGVFDYAPDKTKMPYITVGFVNSLAYRTHSRLGEEIFFDIHIWSAHNGNLEAGQILKRVSFLLSDNTQLCIQGQSLIACYYDGVHTLKETINDVFHRHIVYRLRVLLTSESERV